MNALPEPMLARSGRLPDRDGYAYEPKWDGFRALVRSGSEFRVPSRRGWNMTVRVPELAALPVSAVLDGELIALSEDGWPYFPLVSQRLLLGDSRIPLIYVVFDLLELKGRPTTQLPYVERRRLLESFELKGSHWQTAPSFEDGEALFAVICERGLEGVDRCASEWSQGRHRQHVPVRKAATAYVECSAAAWRVGLACLA
jgi:bifunctional non-homologous end joining protein LigD